MDYYQGVVAEFLVLDRAVFVNTECRIDLQEDRRGPHWYCDIVAVDLRARAIYLCEVSYAKNLKALFERLSEWNSQWPVIEPALRRDCGFDPNWPIRPWLFVPRGCLEVARAGLRKVASTHPLHMPQAWLTSLESVAPWNFSSERCGIAPFLLEPYAVEAPESRLNAVDGPA